MAHHQLWVQDMITINGGSQLNNNINDMLDNSQDDDEDDELPNYG
jgi:hypothetical protein